MLMKVFNKGQIVIPAAIRKELNVAPGDMMDVVVDTKERCIILKKPDKTLSSELAGSLSGFGEGKSFPTEKEIRNSLSKGLSDAG